MAGIKDYSTTQASNTSLNGINTAEGMLPSDLNNAIRALMKNTREWFNDSQWIEYGDGDSAYVPAWVSTTQFTIASSVDITAIYHVNRRLKVLKGDGTVVYGAITASSNNGTLQSITAAFDSGNIGASTNTLRIFIAALSSTNNSIPVGVIGATNIADSSVTTNKIADDAVTTVKIPNNAITTAKINADAVNGTKIADDSINSEHYVDGSIDTAHIADANITTAKIADSNVTTAKIADDAVTISKIADAAIVVASEQSGHTPDDNTFYTTSASNTRFLNKDTSDLINSGQSWSASDNFIATTAAIDARVIDLVDDVGGFVPIANETSFPNANPDVNNGVGTIVSVEALSTNYTANGSGVVTIANGTVGNSTVTLNGCGASASLPSGFGILVESTTTQHTYNFHRLVPKATEVSTVAANATAISNVNSNSANINTVAGNSTNINTVASNNTNVTNVGGSIANVNTTAANITGVNSFAERYRVSSSNPTSSLDSGDLAFVTGDSNLKFYNGSAWVAISPGIANVVDDSSPQLGGNLDLNSNNITGTGGIPSANLTGTIVDARLPTSMSGKTLTTASVTGTINANTLTALGDGSSADGKITLNCSQNSHGVKIQAPAHSAGQSYTLILPTSVGSANQVLASNGSSTNQLSWITAAETKPTVADVSQTIPPATATTINITGTNFVSIPQVQFINGSTGAITNSNTVSFTNATTLSVNVTLASGNYYVRIENPDGNAGRSTNNILTASTAPSFTTGAGSLGSVAGNFSGTVFTVVGSSDSAITFSEVTSGGNVLTASSGANCSLATNGVISTSDFGGTSTAATTYNFTLRITDAEAQTVDRDFSLTSSFGATGGGQFN